MILQGNVFDLLPTLEPGSIDCAVTSPPYWMLRSYLPADHPLKPLELGSEKTLAEYIANQVRVCALVREALAPHGTCWINIGDSYSNTPGNGRGGEGSGLWDGGKPPHRSGGKKTGIPAGNLCLIPQRLAIALQDDGWLLRSVIVWAKPSPMPASVAGWRWARCRVRLKAQGKPHQPSRQAKIKGGPSRDTGSNGTWLGGPEWQDCPGCKKCEANRGYILRRGSWRPTSSWEPILMLAKSARYFADGEPVKTPAVAATVSRDQYTRMLDDPDEQFAVRHDHETVCSGANLRDVWRIAAEQLAEKHYAAFPTELVRLCLQAATSAKGYCAMCGSPWCRVIDPGELIKTGISGNNHPSVGGKHDGVAESNGKWNATHTPGMSYENKTIGWRPSCTCPPHEPRPGRVLDPFAGSGRTGVVCQRLGLDFVGIELHPQYVEMARAILKEEMPLFSGG